MLHDLCKNPTPSICKNPTLFNGKQFHINELFRIAVAGRDHLAQVAPFAVPSRHRPSQPRSR
jgi:hypothetical protein